MLGLGNYDINVIMTALQKKGCAAVWFDKRKYDDDVILFEVEVNVLSIKCFIYREPSTIDTSQVLGFILNVPTDYKIGFVVLPLKRRHWIAIRKINDQYWNLDSKLDSPQSIGNVREILPFGLSYKMERNGESAKDGPGKKILHSFAPLMNICQKTHEKTQRPISFLR